MSIDLNFDESFKYDKESVSLSTVDQDLFIDAKEEKAGRVSYIVKEDASIDDANIEIGRISP
jgi:hypothetical protein